MMARIGSRRFSGCPLRIWTLLLFLGIWGGGAARTETYLKTVEGGSSDSEAVAKKDEAAVARKEISHSRGRREPSRHARGLECRLPHAAPRPSREPSEPILAPLDTSAPPRPLRAPPLAC
jgi:hypothetical protein